MTTAAKFPPCRLENIRGFTAGNMLLTGTVTYFTINAAVHILHFKIFNILMALQASFVAGIVNLIRCIVKQRCSPVMAILAKCVRYQKMP
jgi:hypothetical protein